MVRVPVYLLDTCVLVHYARASKIGQNLEQNYKFRNTPFKPLICVVTLGEVRSFALRCKWGRDKCEKLDVLLSNLVSVDIATPEVINAYALISSTATSKGWAIGHKKNDLWIAAAANVTGATLITTDTDYDPLDGDFLSRIYIDQQTGKIR